MKKLFSIFVILIFIVSDFVNNETLSYANSEGSDLRYTYFTDMKITEELHDNLTGKNVGVAILDTGIDKNHPDLNIIEGVDCAWIISICTNNFGDNYGHGTHVAGIIGAKRNSQGTVGVSPDVSLYNVTTNYDNGSLDQANLLNGLDWVLKYNQNSGSNVIDFINVSIGDYNKNDEVKNKINELYEQGVLSIAAAGNVEEGNTPPSNGHKGDFKNQKEK